MPDANDTDVVDVCIQQVVSILKTYANAEYVVAQEMLASNFHKVELPAIGVIYEGLEAAGDDIKDSGNSTNLVISILVVIGSKDFELKTGQGKTTATEFMAKVRGALFTRQAPTGHKWRFVNELPAVIGKGGLGYVQTWKTRVMISY